MLHTFTLRSLQFRQPARDRLRPLCLRLQATWLCKQRAGDRLELTSTSSLPIAPSGLRKGGHGVRDQMSPCSEPCQSVADESKLDRSKTASRDLVLCEASLMMAKVEARTREQHEWRGGRHLWDQTRSRLDLTTFRLINLFHQVERPHNLS